MLRIDVSLEWGLDLTEFAILVDAGGEVYFVFSPATEGKQKDEAA